jgi:hypothetical protein
VIGLRERAPTTRALFGRGAGAVRAGPFARPSQSGWRHPPCTSRSAIISLAAGLSTVSEIFDGDEQHRPAESRAHACQDLERTEKHHLMATRRDTPRLMRVPTPSASSVPAGAALRESIPLGAEEAEVQDGSYDNADPLS